MPLTVVLVWLAVQLPVAGVIGRALGRADTDAAVTPVAGACGLSPMS